MPDFPTTRISVLLGASTADEPERRRSWNTLVAAYWKPAYKHVRRRWHKPREDAEDLIQTFFERAMEKEIFSGYEPERARFRTYLRTCLDRFVANEEKARTRLKRGGGARALSLDFDGAEEELAKSDHVARSPEDIFDWEWSRHLFATAIEALRRHCEQTGKRVQFELFERYDLSASDPRPTYGELGKEIGLPATTVTNHLAWARRELRRLVIERLEEITANREELRQEAKALFGVDIE